VASYGAIAAGRASLIVSAKPDGLAEVVAHASRYYYLAHAVLTLVVCLLLAQAGREETRAIPIRIALVGWLGCLVVSRIVSPPDHQNFEPWRRRITWLRDGIEEQIRKTPAGAVACIPNQTLQLAGGFPGTLGIYMLYHPGNEFEGRRVYFTSSDPGLLATRLAGSRAESLLLPADGCPPQFPH